VGIALDMKRVHHVPVGAEVARFVSGGRYAVTFGDALRLNGDEQDRPFVRAASDQLMTRILRLSVQSARRLLVPEAARPAGSLYDTAELPVIR
jgi:hypothetical protein